KNHFQLPSVDSLLYAAFSNRYQHLEIDKFAIRGGKLQVLQAGDTLSTLGRLDLRLQHIRVDSASAQSDRLFVTDDIRLTAQNYSTIFSDSLYKLSVEKLAIHSENQMIKLDSLQLIPRYPRFVFGRKKGVEVDRIDLDIPKIRIDGIDFSQWVQSGRFYAQEAIINNAKMVDFRNKNLPFPPNQHPPLPHVALREMDAKLKIDTIQVKDALISYNEYWYETPQAGTLTFEHLNATLTNVTNYPNLIEKGIVIEMNASTQVMGEAQLETHFEFPMNTTVGFHKING